VGKNEGISEKDMNQLVENREKFTLENYKKAEPTPPSDICKDCL